MLLTPFAPAQESAPAAPCSVEVMLSSWRISAFELGVTPGVGDFENHRKKGVYMTLLLRTPAPASFGNMKEEKGELYLEDSTGARSPKLRISRGFTSAFGIVRNKEIKVASAEWLPAPGASKIWLKGTLSQLIGEGVKKSEPVRLPLKAGATTPVTLKKAGANGKDVKAVLSIDRYVTFTHPSEKQKCYTLDLRLTYFTEPVLAYELGLGTADGKLFPARSVTASTCQQYKNFVFEVDGGQSESEITVSVHYIAGLKWVDVPVNIPFGWFRPESVAPEQRKGEEQ